MMSSLLLQAALSERNCNDDLAPCCDNRPPEFAGWNRRMPSSATRAEEGFHPLEGLEDFWLATEAYIFGYPLVTMEMTRRVITNVAAA